MVARTAAKPVAKTAAKPAAATRARTSKPVEVDEDIDLLAGMNTEVNTPDEDDDDDFDLLSDMSESDAQAWMPWDDEDQPNAIQGKVVHVGTVQQDAKYGGDDVPYVELQDKTDPDLVWGIRGYSTVLGNQLEREIDNGLTSGDILAVAFLGIKQNRKGDNEYKNFAVKSKHVGH
jgi:hypothetical protein